LVCADKSERKKVTLDHPIFARWQAQHPGRLQLFSAPTPNGVTVGIMLEETSLAYEPHRIDIMADESHEAAFLALNPNGKIPAIFDPDGPSGTPRSEKKPMKIRTIIPPPALPSPFSIAGADE
jgi:GST-like protein